MKGRGIVSPPRGEKNVREEVVTFPGESLAKIVPWGGGKPYCPARVSLRLPIFYWRAAEGGLRMSVGEEERLDTRGRGTIHRAVEE